MLASCVKTILIQRPRVLNVQLRHANWRLNSCKLQESVVNVPHIPTRLKMARVARLKSVTTQPKFLERMESAQHVEDFLTQKL